ncbi:MAG TPA: hypothetical protein P5056_00210 [Candidatus Paceibacterota bacterium]|nr:hypothetical protein [Candidatus Paceibacterota bacterium]
MKARNTPDTIIEKIYNNQEKIFSNIDKESVDTYQWLNTAYNSGGIDHNRVFQFVFRSYYRLDGAGLSQNQKRTFFDLMTNKIRDLEKILDALYQLPTLRGNNTIQFSFATKLIHTIDNNEPIFDAEVSNVIQRRVAGNNKEQKIQSCVELYNFLKSLYLKLLSDDKIKELISIFRKEFGVNKYQVSDIKILDFIVWTLGKLEKMENKIS